MTTLPDRPIVAWDHGIGAPAYDFPGGISHAFVRSRRHGDSLTKLCWPHQILADSNLRRGGRLRLDPPSRDPRPPVLCLECGVAAGIVDWRLHQEAQLGCVGRWPRHAEIRNAELLREIAAVIREDPRRWSQRESGGRSADLTWGDLFGWALMLCYGEEACFHPADKARWAELDARPETFSSPADPMGGGSVVSDGGDLLGLDQTERFTLYRVEWRPAVGMTVADALDALADGAPVESVTLDRQP